MALLQPMPCDSILAVYPNRERESSRLYEPEEEVLLYRIEWSSYV